MLECPICNLQYSYTDPFKADMAQPDHGTEAQNEEEMDDGKTLKESLLEATSDYNATLLSALGASNGPSEHQQKTILAVKLTELEPLVFTDHHSEEDHLLGTSRNISNLIEHQYDYPNAPFKCFPPLMKRSYNDTVMSVIDCRL
ncbi:hypothetical protein DFQ29_000473 [Apophysomyces sp. BC1021]|nr:hypothetical protein DFQ29_000473 [Apophysomyces sp. BC1021]